MNRLIRIGILWCLAISTGRAQEAVRFKEASQTPTLETEQPSSLPASEPTPVNGQPSPFRPTRSEPPRRVAEPKRIVIQPGVDAQESEVAMQFMADLEKAGIAKIDKTEMTPTSDSPVVVQVFIREDESFEKIKQFIVVLRHSGLEHMVLEYGGIHPEGRGEPENGLVFRTILGFSPDELKGLEKAAQKAAEDCGLAVHFGGTLIASSATNDARIAAAAHPSPYRPADPQPPQPVEPKRITVFPAGDAQESEVAMKFIAYLEKEGFATGKVTELALTPDSPLRVDFIMRHDESHEKVKEFLTSLGDAGVERIFFETDENVYGGEEENGLSFRAIPGYSPVEVERIENAAVSAAKSCGLALRLGGTYVKSWKPNGESATVSSLRPVELKRIAVFAEVDEEPTEMVARFLTDLESDGIANVEAKASAPAFRYPIQLNFVPKEDEPLEKIKQFIVALRQSGVEQINCDLRGHRGGSNLVLFTVLPGYSHEEQQRIENAVRTAAANCGLSIGLAGTMVFSSDANARKITQLRTDYEAANKQAHDLAESLRQTPDAAKKAELRTAVQRAFTARQSLLRAELQEMQARLEKTQQSLDMRDRIADQIVDRRVEDLLNPELKWDNSSKSEFHEQASSAPKYQLLGFRLARDTAKTSDQIESFMSPNITAIIPGSAAEASGFLPGDQVFAVNGLYTWGIDEFIRVIERQSAGPIECMVLREQRSITLELQIPPEIAATPLANAAQREDSRNTRMVAPVTELEGDWHLVSATDSLGKAVEVPPYNVSFRNDRYTIAYLGGQFERLVQVYPDSKRIGGFMDNRGFLADNYRIEGDQLTLSGDGVTMLYQRGHIARPKTIPNATEEQKSRWRSGIVDIYWEHHTPAEMRQDPVGKGVVISPNGIVICQVPEEIQSERDSKTKFIVRFDDGGFAYTTIVEEADHGWFALQPTQPGNHQFPVSTLPMSVGDQVHLWACDSATPPPGITVDLAKVILLDRQATTANTSVCQLTRPIDFRAHSCPVLSGDGELLAITLRGTGDLVLAVPVAELKTMFPKSLGQLQDSEMPSEPPAVDPQ